MTLESVGDRGTEEKQGIILLSIYVMSMGEVIVMYLISVHTLQCHNKRSAEDTRYVSADHTLNTKRTQC